MSTKIFILTLCFFYYLKTTAQVKITNAPSYIKTIIFKSGNEQSELPILKLNAPLTLQFDVLNDDEGDFYYTIEHYNFDWKPSNLNKQEYLDGFDNLRIQNFDNSFNTYQSYSHYSLQIPNSQTKLKVTGNYLIKIFDDYGDLVFSRKFMVYKNQSSVSVSIKRSRDVKFINEKQMVDFKINPLAISIINPKETIKTVIIQNNNLNSAIHHLKPKYTIGTELIYQQDNASAFWGGNEYLNFENKNIRSATSAIAYIDLKEIYHNYLYPDLFRANSPYTYNPDINGNFLITALDTNTIDTEADYAMVHFKLKLSELPSTQKLYIFGSFNNYALTDENLMSFNKKTNSYQGQLILKQGFYNYKYVIKNSDGKINENAISGNFDETENNYKVLVYYRNLGGRYDEIIGFGEGNSKNITN